ncbi:hypothetical protein [Isoptericola aurantiacus]|uniref:hypothetical protein n=1 Tax=Isoptericola aurantiacus TaxID=3377839 RepID=UPI00383ABA84
MAGPAMVAIGLSMNTSYSNDGGPLVLIGGIVGVLGLILAAMGIFFAVSNLDTIAAVKFNEELRTLRAVRSEDVTGPEV